MGSTLAYLAYRSLLAEIRSLSLPGNETQFHESLMSGQHIAAYMPGTHTYMYI